MVSHCSIYDLIHALIRPMFEETRTPCTKRRVVLCLVVVALTVITKAFAGVLCVKSAAAEASAHQAHNRVAGKSSQTCWCAQLDSLGIPLPGVCFLPVPIFEAVGQAYGSSY
jgi:hypothetical protein